MKFKWITAIAITAMAITSCSEDTEGIGASLTDENDMLEITTGSFTAYTRSIEVDSVFSRNFDCHLGMVKDPETGAYAIFQAFDLARVDVETFSANVARIADKTEYWRKVLNAFQVAEQEKGAAAAEEVLVDAIHGGTSGFIQV